MTLTGHTELEVTIGLPNGKVPYAVRTQNKHPHQRTSRVPGQVLAAKPVWHHQHIEVIKAVRQDESNQGVRADRRVLQTGLGHVIVEK